MRGRSRNHDLMRKAFEELSPRLLGLATRLTGDPSDAEDHLQDLWADFERIAEGAESAWPSRPDLEELHKTLAYRLCREVRGLRRKRNRRRRLRARHQPRPVMTQDSETNLIGRIHAQRVLERARPDDAQVLRLRFFHDLPIKDVAKALGCSPEAAKKRVARAIERARERG